MPRTALSLTGDLVDAADVSRDDRGHKGERWKCPGCVKAVLFKNCQARENWHFAHLARGDCAHERVVELSQV